jgi:hypothetical protein
MSFYIPPKGDLREKLTPLITVNFVVFFLNDQLGAVVLNLLISRRVTEEWLKGKNSGKLLR